MNVYKIILQEVIGQYAEIIYDVCVENDINPVLCVAQSGIESSFGTAGIATSHPYNYWGLKGGEDGWMSFDSMERAVEVYCGLILSFQDHNDWRYSTCLERGAAYSEYSNKFSGTSVGIYEILTVYDPLPEVHGEGTREGINARSVDGLVCDHIVGEPTTIEERAAHAIWYVEYGLFPVAESVFGDLAFTSGASDILGVCEELTQILIDSGTYQYSYDSSGNPVGACSDIRQYYYEPEDGGCTKIVCADYVSMVLYKMELLDADFINTHHFHSASGVRDMLRDAGWEECDFSEAEPGDIGCWVGSNGHGHTFFLYYNDTIWDQQIGQNRTEPGGFESLANSVYFKPPQ